MQRYVGKVALVTGASAGVGTHICKKLVNNGMIVVGCARALDKMQDISNDREIRTGPGKLHPISCNLSQRKEVIKMFKFIERTYGGLHVCINNAGFVPREASEIEDWRHFLEVTPKELSLSTQESLYLMGKKKGSGGQIIQLLSILAQHIPILQGINAPGALINYGMILFMQSAMKSVKAEMKHEGSNIRITTISPGIVQPRSMTKVIGEKEPAKFFNQYQCLQPKDIVDVVTYILSTPSHVNIEDVILKPLTRYRPEDVESKKNE